jgi:hypothetical protein
MDTHSRPEHSEAIRLRAEPEFRQLARMLRRTRSIDMASLFTEIAPNYCETDDEANQPLKRSCDAQLISFVPRLKAKGSGRETR